VFNAVKKSTREDPAGYICAFREFFGHRSYLCDDFLPQMHKFLAEALPFEIPLIPPSQLIFYMAFFSHLAESDSNTATGEYCRPHVGSSPIINKPA
jgi:hypothetical protein